MKQINSTFFQTIRVLTQTPARIPAQMVYQKLNQVIKLGLSNWSLCCFLFLSVLTLLHGAPAWAANGRSFNQTVPYTPTAPVEETEEPLVTPTPLPATALPPTEAPPTEAPTNEPPPQATEAPANPTSEPIPPVDGGNGGSGGGGGGAGGSSGGTQGNSNNASATTSVTTTLRYSGTIAVASLNVRNKPGTSGTVIGTLKRNTVVTILYRNQLGDWWQVCCLPGSTTVGWVNGQFLKPTFERRNALSSLTVAPELAGLALIPSPPNSQSAITNTKAVTGTQPITKTQSAAKPDQAKPNPAYALQILVTQKPDFPIQGQEVLWEVVITNPGELIGEQVELRNELPPGLSFMEGKATNGGTISRETTKEGKEVFRVLWTQFAAKSSVIATIKLKVESSVADGAVLDNLLYAGATNINGVATQVMIGMPPASLPSFQ